MKLLKREAWTIIGLLILAATIYSAKHTTKNPCSDLPEHTDKERLEKSYCDIGNFVKEGKI